MSGCVIRLIALHSGVRSIYEGNYVRRYDPTWHPAGERYDGGLLITSPNRADAKVFADAGEAMEYYRQSHGTRPDGKPNRPLTAWTVEIST